MITDEQVEAAARARYAHMTGNDPIVHANRFPAWDEIPSDGREQHLAAMRAALEAAALAAPQPTAAPGEYDNLCEKLITPDRSNGFRASSSVDLACEAAAAIRQLSDKLAWAEHTIEEQRIRINAAEAEAARLQAALAALVSWKDYKADHGRDAMYERIWHSEWEKRGTKP